MSNGNLRIFEPLSVCRVLGLFKTALDAKGSTAVPCLHRFGASMPTVGRHRTDQDHGVQLCLMASRVGRERESLTLRALTLPAPTMMTVRRVAQKSAIAPKTTYLLELECEASREPLACLPRKAGASMAPTTQVFRASSAPHCSRP